MRRAALVVLALLVSAPPAAARHGVDWSERVAAYRLILFRFPDDVGARFALAAAEAHEGLVLDAYRQLQTLARLVPPADRPAALRSLAADARAILERHPDDLHARYRLGLALYLSGDPAGALTEARRARAAEPDNVWTIACYGYLQSELGDRDGAIATWQEGLRRDPDNGVLHYVLSLAYARKGDLRRAGRHLARAYRDRGVFGPPDAGR